MKTELIAFVESVTDWIKSGENENDAADGLSHRQEFTLIGWAGGPTLQFGYGYHQPYNVLYAAAADQVPQEMSVQDGVSAFLKACRAGK